VARRLRPPGLAERGLLTLCGFVLLFGGWWAASRSGLVTPRVLPGPDAVLEAFLGLTRDPFAGATLQQHLFFSFLRYGAGFLLAAAIGVPLGLTMGWSRWLDAVVTPVFEALRFVAPIAWVPFAALWFGTGVGGPILIIFAGAFPACLVNAYRGARLVDTRLIEAARVHGASGLRIIVEVLIPGALPSIVAGLRIGAGLGWQSLVGAELIVVSSGIGYLMVQGQSNLATPIVMSGMVAIGIVGLLIDLGLRSFEGWVARGWRAA
jgi:NitT/TauT family transport system permease protein